MIGAATAYRPLLGGHFCQQWPQSAKTHFQYRPPS